MLSVRQINKMLRRQNDFISLTGLVCCEADCGRCIMEAEVGSNMLNTNGMAHGGFLFTLADTACGLAGGLTEKGWRRLVTQSAAVYYIRACEPGTHIRAVAERVHGGRSTGVVSCGIFDGQDRLLLRGEFSVFYLGGYVETEAE